MKTSPLPKKRSNIPPAPKHGAHDKPMEKQRNPTPETPIDPEDPLGVGMQDHEIEPWENEDERLLRDESEDPDAPQNL